jgi:hypothetical protein
MGVHRISVPNSSFGVHNLIARTQFALYLWNGFAARMRRIGSSWQAWQPAGQKKAHVNFFKCANGLVRREMRVRRTLVTIQGLFYIAF